MGDDGGWWVGCGPRVRKLLVAIGEVTMISCVVVFIKRTYDGSSTTIGILPN